MAAKNVAPPIERVQESYRRLSVVAFTLNQASDKLGETVNELDAALKKLNLGVTSWVHFSNSHSECGQYYSYEDIGYAKVGSKWGLAIRTVSGDQASPDDESLDSWSFNEAPRGLRIRAIAKIPDLLDQLVKDGAEAAKKIEDQTQQIGLLTEAIKNIDGTRKSEVVLNAPPKN